MFLVKLLLIHNIAFYSKLNNSQNFISDFISFRKYSLLKCVIDIREKESNIIAAQTLFFASFLMTKFFYILAMSFFVPIDNFLLNWLLEYTL